MFLLFLFIMTLASSFSSDSLIPISQKSYSCGVTVLEVICKCSDHITALMLSRGGIHISCKSRSAAMRSSGPRTGRGSTGKTAVKTERMKVGRGRRDSDALQGSTNRTRCSCRRANSCLSLFCLGAFRVALFKQCLQ